MASTTLVSVMYHYVRPDDPVNWGGIHPLDPQEFARQLDALASVGQIIPPSEAGRSGHPVEIVGLGDVGTHRGTRADDPSRARIDLEDERRRPAGRDPGTGR